MNVRNLIVDNLDRILSFWLMVDVEGKIVHCGRMVYEKLGYSEYDLIGRQFQSIFPNNDPKNEDYLFQLLFDSHLGTIVNQKARIRQKNGIIIDVELSAYQLDSESERFILITFENITEVIEIRKVVKSKIEKLHDQFSLIDNHMVYSSVKDIIDVILVSITAGQGLKFNRGFLFLIDQDNNKLCGIQAIGPGSGEEAGVIYSMFETGPDTLEAMIEQYRSLVDTDSTVNKLVQSIEIDLNDYQNVLIKALDSQRYILVNDEYPMVNDPGTSWLKQILSVNEYVVVPLVWHSRSMGVVVVDNQVTKSRISNFDIKGITRFADTAINSLESTRLLASLDRSIDQLQQANLKIRESQEILLQKEKLAAMGELLTHMAHEIRGPVATIGGYAGRVFKQLDEESDHYGYLSKIIEAVETLEVLINDILDGSIPIPAAYEGCDCTKAVNKVLSMLEEEIHKRKISVSLNIQGNLPKVSIKEHHLFEIVNNLVRNAIEAIGSDGLLLILASRIESKVVISIQDTGPGISEEIKEKIYTPFFTTKTGGTGLGLVVVKKLVEENNGTLEVRSIIDKGTTFVISFPIKPIGAVNE